MSGPYPCCVCGQPIIPAEGRPIRGWYDPGRQVCFAHTDCLRRLGELEPEPA